MIYYSRKFDTEEEKYDFVKKCDDEFFGKIERTADEIAVHKDIRFILLSGPSCSGKTSATNVLKRTLTADGRDVMTVSVDDFYRSVGEHEKTGGKRDYETIASIDYEYFCTCVSQLKRNEKTNIPIFDFKTGSRTGYYEVRPNENTVTIIEGIQAFYPEITSLFTHDECKKIFICVSTDLCAYGYEFTRRQLRFARRLVRDYLSRGADAQLTFELWQDVISNEDKNIMPYADEADIQINSFVPYEVNVLAPYLQYILPQLSPQSEFALQGREILEKYKEIPHIKCRYVPENSFFREFIGK